MKNNLNLKLSHKFLITLLQLFIVIIIYYYIFSKLIPHEIFLDSIDYVGLQIQQYLVEQAAYQQDLINDLTEAFSLEDIEEIEEDLLCYIEEDDSDIEFVKDSDSDDESNNSESSNSILPLILIIVHQKLLKKINKIKTKWNKMISTPIILDIVHRNRSIKSNNPKFLKLIAISLIFISIMFISLIFYPPLLDNLNLSYLLLNITNFMDYITNHLYSFTQYCRDLYNIFNFTDNTSKIITPDTKLIDDYNENSNNVDNKDITGSTPFYKSKLFIICGIVVASSVLIYLYFNNLLPIPYDSGANNIQNVDRYLEVIQQQAIRFNQLQNNYLVLLNENHDLVDYRERYIEIINNFQLIKEGLELNVETLEFLGDHFENLVHTEDFLGQLTDNSDSVHSS